MKNQCRPEFAGSDDDEAEEFELSFVNERPLVPMETRIGEFPPVQRPLHTEKLLNVFEVAEHGERASVIAFTRSEKTADSIARRQTWFEQHGKHIASQLKYTACELGGGTYVASFGQLLGRVAINTPGRLRSVNDEWLRSTLDRIRVYDDAASDLGLALPLTPSVVSTQGLFGEYYLSPFVLLDGETGAQSPSAQHLLGASTLIKTLYWLIGGINLFDDDVEPSLLSKWAPELSKHHAERLKAAVEGRINSTRIGFLIEELAKGRIHQTATTQADPATKKPSVAEDEPQGLNAITGRQSLKQTLMRLVAQHKPQDSPAATRTSAFSAMLFGPSGCGKTYIAKRLAEELDVELIRVRPSDISSMFVRESLARLRGFFDEAIKNKPCMLFFDDFDFLVPDRSRLLPGLEYKVEEFNEFLTGLALAKEEGVFVLAATNQPFIVDRSVFQAGRFDKIIYVDPPGEEDRSDLLLAYLQGSQLVENFDPSLISDVLDGYSAADLRAVAAAATDVSTSLGRCPISLPMVTQTLSTIKPSISRDVEQRFAKFIARGYDE